MLQRVVQLVFINHRLCSGTALGTGDTSQMPLEDALSPGSTDIKGELEEQERRSPGSVEGGAEGFSLVWGLGEAP